MYDHIGPPHRTQPGKNDRKAFRGLGIQTPRSRKAFRSDVGALWVAHTASAFSASSSVSCCGSSRRAMLGVTCHAFGGIAATHGQSEKLNPVRSPRVAPRQARERPVCGLFPRVGSLDGFGVFRNSSASCPKDADANIQGLKHRTKNENSLSENKLHDRKRIKKVCFRQTTFATIFPTEIL